MTTLQAKFPNQSHFEFDLIIIYGFDGSGGHSLYSMPMGASNSNVSETNLFSTFICPIKLTEKRTKTIIWQNSAPSSPVYCRPLRLKFIKETPDVTRKELEDYNHIPQVIVQCIT